jgi:hypothetical protein
MLKGLRRAIPAIPYMLERVKALFRMRNSSVASCGHVRRFDQPHNRATFTMRQVLDGSEPILLVSHEADDGSWQFIGSTDACVEDCRVVCLECMVAHDPSVLEIADLPPGWQAVRRSPGHPWQRRLIPPDD